jgi:O-antigen/teichoic acid export membrane protein
MLLIGLLSTNAEVGLFRVADSTAQVCGFAVSLFNFVSISMFARFWAGREMEKLQKIASATTAGILVGAIVLSLPVVLFGYPLLSLFFGKSFAPAYPALIILCGGGLVYGIFGLSGSLLNMTGNERCVTRAIALALVGSVTLAVVLVPLLGAVGGAIANVAGLTIWNISTWRDAKNRVGVDTSILAAVRVLKARWL